MPAKKTTKANTKHTNTPATDSDSEPIDMPVSEPVEIQPKKSSLQPMYISSGSSKNTDSDRIQLAQAINNFTIKSEQFMQEMKNFDSFKENVLKLELMIDSKKQEHQQTISALEQDYMTKKKNLETHYEELTKKLKSEYDDLSKKLGTDHQDKIKHCESEFADKNKQLNNMFEDESIKLKRNLEADKAKACADYAKALKMRFVKEDEYKELVDNVNKAQHDYNELKKTFDKQCNSIKEEEKAKYKHQLDMDTKTMDLTHKATNANLNAQVEQQKREIEVLHNTIENLKSELKEQRELTKQVAQAGAKSQITQTIGKN